MPFTAKISDQIADKQTRLGEISTAIKSLFAVADEEQSGNLTEDQDAEYEILVEEEKQVSEDISALESRQKQQQQRRADQATREERVSKGTGRVSTPDAIADNSVRTVPAQVRDTEDEAKHFIGQAVLAIAHGGTNRQASAHFAAEMWGAGSPVSIAMGASSQSGGGFLVPENYVPNLIELLRPLSIVRAMGAVTAPLVNGSLTLPRQTAGASASYIGENANVPTGQPTGGQLKLVEKKLAAMIPVSNDLIRNASPSAEQFVRNDLIRAMATAEDVAFIRDDGSGNAPKGLRYWAAVANIIAANGTVNLVNVTSDLNSMLLALMNANVSLTNPGWMFAPRTWSYLEGLRDGNGNKAFPEMANGLLKGYPFKTSTQIPTNLGGGSNESEVYFANFDDVIIADSAQVELSASDVAAYHDGTNVVAAYSLDQTVVRAIARHDIGVRHDESVAVLTAVTWS